MSKKLYTKNSKINAAKLIYNDLISTNNTHYIFVGKSLPYPNNDSPLDIGDETPDVSFYDHYRDMIFGKKITNSDVSIMFERKDWQTNTIFEMYRNDIDVSNTYVCVNTGSNIEVFKCLYNNSNNVSTVQPDLTLTSEDEEFFELSDGYVWKYLFSVPGADVSKFGSLTHLPFQENSNVSGNAINGSLTTILVNSGGSRYNSYSNGFFQQSAVNGNTLLYAIDSSASGNTDFYKNSAIKITDGTGSGQQRTITEYIVSGTQKRVLIDQEFDPLPDLTSKYEITPRVIITGDGKNALARAIVNTTSNSIYSVEISNTGSGYSWADATVIANTGVVVDNTAIIANSASLTVIIPPKGGHGSDQSFEVGANYVGISVKFSNTENGTIPTDNDFRKIGILKNPKFSNVQFTISNATGNFTLGETIVQDDTNASAFVENWVSGTGLLKVSNASGSFVVGNSTHGVIRGDTSNTSGEISAIENNSMNKLFETFDQTTRLAITKIGITDFIEDEFINQAETNANGYVYYANSSLISVVNTKGTFNVSDINQTFTISGDTSDASANVTGKVSPDLEEFSGDLLYIENIESISRANTQSETIKLIIKS